MHSRSGHSRDPLTALFHNNKQPQSHSPAGHLVASKTMLSSYLYPLTSLHRNTHTHTASLTRFQQGLEKAAFCCSSHCPFVLLTRMPCVPAEKAFIPLNHGVVFHSLMLSETRWCLSVKAGFTVYTLASRCCEGHRRRLCQRPCWGWHPAVSAHQDYRDNTFSMPVWINIENNNFTF